MPVFLAAISTILGAVMFLRFGYAVAHAGLVGALGIVLLGHLVTVPTALAISEIATNRRVGGGGEYFVISRSFGLRIGGAIGLSLYVSQAISVAFYALAFAEAFTPLAPRIEALLGMAFDPRMVSIPLVLLLLGLMLSKGADLGVAALYVVVSVLLVSMALFFAGSPLPGAAEAFRLDERVANPDPFVTVFAIVFPAFTGMTAGVGLSGDLEKPGRSIPLGTIGATLVGMVAYVAIVWKLAVSAPAQVLAEDQLAMGRIAVWGPIIPIGLACATLSSALGSILVAPRTLQALGRDGVLPAPALNGVLARGAGKANEPRNATLLTCALAIATCALGNVDAVARLVSMFFMVTYGALCTISALEHFAASPGYRPSFRSRWYLSLLGALLCLFMMFQMDPLFAVLSLAAMCGLYAATKRTPAGETGQDLGTIFRGVMGQAIRRMNIRLQRRRSARLDPDWRPSVVALDPRPSTGDRAGLQMLSWLCDRHGFGTYLRLVPGELDEETLERSDRIKADLVEICKRSYPGVYAGTVISPSLRQALVQTLQMPGASGMENNTFLLEFEADDSAEHVERIVQSALLASRADKNLLFLRHGERRFGDRSEVHLWLTWHDTQNASLMVLLTYILLDHEDWEDAEITVLAAYPAEHVADERERFVSLVEAGRIPVPRRNIRFFVVAEGEEFRELVGRLSSGADLVVMGITLARLQEKGTDLLTRHPGLGEVLFVMAEEKVAIE